MPETKRMSPIGSLTWGTANTRSQDTTSSVWPCTRNGVKTAIELPAPEWPIDPLAGADRSGGLVSLSEALVSHEPDQVAPAPVAALPASIAFVCRERGTDRVTEYCRDGELAGYDLVRQFLTSDGRSSRAGHPHRDRAPAAPRHKTRTGAPSPDDDLAKCHSRRSRPDRRRLQRGARRVPGGRCDADCSPRGSIERGRGWAKVGTAGE